MSEPSGPLAPITFELSREDLDIAMRELWESAPAGTAVARARRNARLGPLVMLLGVWLAGAIVVAATVLLHDPRRPPLHAIDILTSSIPFAVLGVLGAWALRWKLSVTRWVTRILRSPQTLKLLHQPQQLELTDQGLAHTIGDQRAVYGRGSIRSVVSGAHTLRIVLSHERHLFVPRRAFIDQSAAETFRAQINVRQTHADPERNPL